MRASLQSLAAGLLALGFASAPADAQCLLPDNLTGPCCEFTQLTLPNFPNFTQQGLALCFKECVDIDQECISMTWSAPEPGFFNCGQYRSEINIDTCSGTSLLKGFVTLDYTRTWTETPISPVITGPVQIWRFVAKVDMSGSPLSTTDCLVPPSLGVYNSAFYYGYVDYALDCSTNEWSQSTVLYHACDWLIHQPGLSDKPGVFNPDTSYALVAPNTPANPFVPGFSVVPGAPLIAEAMREVTPGPSTVPPCKYEEPLINGLYQPIGFGCLCPPSLGPIQMAGLEVRGEGACGSSFESLNPFPSAPWFGAMSISIGSWTTNATYPGEERARVHEGLYQYAEGCPDPTGVPGVTLDIFYGAETRGGWPVAPTPVGMPLTQHFVDLASNYSNSIFDPIALPAVGSVRPTDHLIYVNL